MQCPSFKPRFCIINRILSPLVEGLDEEQKFTLKLIGLDPSKSLAKCALGLRGAVLRLHSEATINAQRHTDAQRLLDEEIDARQRESKRSADSTAAALAAANARTEALNVDIEDYGRWNFQPNEQLTTSHRDSDALRAELDDRSAIQQTSQTHYAVNISHLDSTEALLLAAHERITVLDAQLSMMGGNEIRLISNLKLTNSVISSVRAESDRPSASTVGSQRSYETQSAFLEGARGEISATCEAHKRALQKIQQQQLKIEALDTKIANFNADFVQKGDLMYQEGLASARARISEAAAAAAATRCAVVLDESNMDANVAQLEVDASLIREQLLSRDAALSAQEKYMNDLEKESTTVNHELQSESLSFKDVESYAHEVEGIRVNERLAFAADFDRAKHEISRVSSIASDEDKAAKSLMAELREAIDSGSELDVARNADHQAYSDDLSQARIEIERLSSIVSDEDKSIKSLGIELQQALVRGSEYKTELDEAAPTVEKSPRRDRAYEFAASQDRIAELTAENSELRRSAETSERTRRLSRSRSSLGNENQHILDDLRRAQHDNSALRRQIEELEVRLNPPDFQTCRSIAPTVATVRHIDDLEIGYEALDHASPSVAIPKFPLGETVRPSTPPQSVSKFAIGSPGNSDHADDLAPVIDEVCIRCRELKTSNAEIVQYLHSGQAHLQVAKVENAAVLQREEVFKTQARQARELHFRSSGTVKALEAESAQQINHTAQLREHLEVQDAQAAQSRAELRAWEPEFSAEVREATRLPDLTFQWRGHCAKLDGQIGSLTEQAQELHNQNQILRVVMDGDDFGNSEAVEAAIDATALSEAVQALLHANLALQRSESKCEGLSEKVSAVNTELEHERMDSIHTATEAARSSSGNDVTWERDMLKTNLEALSLETDTYVGDIRWFSAYVRYDCKRGHPRAFNAATVRAKRPIPSSVHNLSQVSSIIQSQSAAESGDDRSVRFSDDEGTELPPDQSSESDFDSDPHSSAGSQTEGQEGGPPTEAPGDDDEDGDDGDDDDGDEGEEDDDQEEDEEEDEEDEDDAVSDNGGTTDADHLGELPKLSKKKATTRIPQTDREWAAQIAAGVESDPASDTNAFLAMKLRSVESTEDLRKNTELVMSCLAPHPPARPGVAAQTLDVVTAAGQFDGMTVLQRNDVDQKELDKAIAAEAKFRAMVAASAADEASAVSPAPSGIGSQSLATTAEYINLPQLGEYYSKDGSLVKMCPHGKLKAECLICSHGGQMPTDQITRDEFRPPTDAWHKNPFDPRASKLTEFHKTKAMGTAMVYRNPTTLTAGGEPVSQDVKDEVFSKAEMISIPQPTYANNQRTGPSALAIDPIHLMQQFDPNPANQASAPGSARVDGFALPAMGMDGFSGAHTPTSALPYPMQQPGTGTITTKLPKTLDLGKFPAHRTEWERWKWNFCEVLNLTAPRTNGDSLILYIVYSPAEKWATIKDLFNRFYANPAYLAYMKLIDPMLVQAFRDMDGFPADIDRQILEQNRRYTAETVPILSKRKTVAVEVLFWMYQHNVSKGPLDMYRYWVDLKQLRWKADKYVEILELYDVWKIIFDDIGETEFESKITEVELYFRKKLERSNDSYIKHKLQRYEQDVALKGDSVRYYSLLLGVLMDRCRLFRHATEEEEKKNARQHKRDVSSDMFKDDADKKTTPKRTPKKVKGDDDYALLAAGKGGGRGKGTTDSHKKKQTDMSKAEKTADNKQKRERSKERKSGGQSGQSGNESAGTAGRAAKAKGKAAAKAPTQPQSAKAKAAAKKKAEDEKEKKKKAEKNKKGGGKGGRGRGKSGAAPAPESLSAPELAAARKKLPCWDTNCGRLKQSPLHQYAKKDCTRGNDCDFNHDIKQSLEEFHARDPPRIRQAEMTDKKFDWKTTLEKLRKKSTAAPAPKSGKGSDSEAEKKKKKEKAAAKAKGIATKSKSTRPKLPAAPAKSEDEREKATTRVQTRTENMPPLKFCEDFMNKECTHLDNACPNGAHVDSVKWMKAAAGALRANAKDMILVGAVKPPAQK